MKIDDKLVDRLSVLAKLEFEAEAKEEIRKDLNRMLEFVDKLNELNTEHVEPLIYLNEEPNVLRKDEVKETIKQDDALKNAPKKDSDYFKVPKVIDK